MISSDPPTGDNAAFYSRIVSDGALLQLLTCFIVGSTRPDPYVVGPLIALYATRESDRRGMFLYLVVTAIAGLFEFLYLLRGGPSGWWETLQTLVQLFLKVGMLYPGLKLHDKLPARRAPRVEPSELKEQMAAVVQQVLREQIERMATKPAVMPSAAPAAATAAGADTSSWDQV
mmetsp:Transcript_45090/g.119055  ORF Transcript_45090/g.119055 Transcript_45090/m.119055 type:complete len:174 (-) Transcript_45090:87-608(-)